MIYRAHRSGSSGKVVVLAIGSRGDVAPMVELARGICAIGADAEVIGLSDYSWLAKAAGVRFHSIGCSMDSMRELVVGVRGETALESAHAQLRLLRRWLRRIAFDLARTIVEVVEEGDIVVTGVLSRECGRALNRMLGCDVATIVLTGLLPSSSPDSCLYFSSETAPTWMRRARAQISWRMLSGVSRSASRQIETFLAQRGKRRYSRRRPGAWHKVVLAASPTLVPAAIDWGPDMIQTGYPICLDAGRPSDDDKLISLLRDASPCIYAGFGSAGEANDTLAIRLENQIVQAAEHAGMNVLVPVRKGTSPGWVSPHVLRIGDVDHKWLFPKVDGIVHHGGVGTTMTGLLSGIPAAVVHFAFDQAYHGRRIAKLGVGPAPVGVKELDASVLESTLIAMTRAPESHMYRTRAREVAKMISCEDGLSATISALF